MRRLSPQDIDREINEQIEDDSMLQWLSIGTTSPVPREPVKDAPEPGQLRRHKRHGRMPTLEDMERRM